MQPNKQCNQINKLKMCRKDTAKKDFSHLNRINKTKIPQNIVTLGLKYFHTYVNVIGRCSGCPSTWKSNVSWKSPR